MADDKWYRVAEVVHYMPIEFRIDGFSDEDDEHLLEIRSYMSYPALMYWQWKAYDRIDG